jgi:hypothetical protein
MLRVLQTSTLPPMPPLAMFSPFGEYVNTVLGYDLSGLPYCVYYFKSQNLIVPSSLLEQASSKLLGEQLKLIIAAVGTTSDLPS